MERRTFTGKIPPPFFGSSLIIGPLGNVLAKAGSKDEEILSAELDFEDMREAKRRYHFFRDWRPEAYDVYSRMYSGMGTVSSSPEAAEKDTGIPES
ncbi:nitrilase-related carbon-nitrogen hydrolase [Chloroflexota bacterium]